MAGSVRLQVQLVAQLSRWLDAEGLGVGGLTELAAERFIHRRSPGVERLLRSRQALEPVIGYLRDLGVLPAPVAAGRGRTILHATSATARIRFGCR